MIFISHDLSIAAELADRMITMYAGRVVEEPNVNDMFYRPRHPYSVGLLRAVPRVSGALGSVASIPGSPPDLIRLPIGCSYDAALPVRIEACARRDPPLAPGRHATTSTPRCIRWEHVAEVLGSDAEVASRGEARMTALIELDHVEPDLRDARRHDHGCRLRLARARSG